MCRAHLDARQIVEAKAQDLEPDEQIDISVTNFKHSSKVCQYKWLGSVYILS